MPGRGYVDMGLMSVSNNDISHATCVPLIWSYNFRSSALAVAIGAITALPEAPASCLAVSRERPAPKSLRLAVDATLPLEDADADRRRAVRMTTFFFPDDFFCPDLFLP